MHLAGPSFDAILVLEILITLLLVMKLTPSFRCLQDDTYTESYISTIGVDFVSQMEGLTLVKELLSDIQRSKLSNVTYNY